MVFSCFYSRQTAEQAGILFIFPINRRNSGERKNTDRLVLPVFLKTRFGQWLFGLPCEIERVFNDLKSDGVEGTDFIDMYCLCDVTSLCITSSVYFSFATPS
jgi:hypothetical protein